MRRARTVIYQRFPTTVAVARKRRCHRRFTNRVSGSFKEIANQA